MRKYPLKKTFNQIFIYLSFINFNKTKYNIDLLYFYAIKFNYIKFY